MLTKSDMARLAAMLRNGEWHSLKAITADKRWPTNIHTALEMLHWSGILRTKELEDDTLYQWTDTPRWLVEIDNKAEIVEAWSLAAVCNQVRGRGKHIRVDSPEGIQMVNTQFGDPYELVAK